MNYNCEKACNDCIECFIIVKQSYTSPFYIFSYNIYLGIHYDKIYDNIIYIS